MIKIRIAALLNIRGCKSSRNPRFVFSAWTDAARTPFARMPARDFAYRQTSSFSALLFLLYFGSVWCGFVAM